MAFSRERQFGGSRGGKSGGRSSGRSGGGSSGGRGFGGRGSGGRSSGGRDFDGSPRGSNSRGFRGGRDSGRSEFKEMVKVTCDSCGTKCEVPFKPTEGKPVYCDDCFKSHKPDDDRRSSRGGDSGNSSKEIAELHKKVDKILAILEEINS